MCVREIVLKVMLGMAVTTYVAAAPSNLGRVQQLLQAVPQAGQQLRNLAVDGKVLFKAACVAAVCAMSFASPGSADLQDLSSPSELLRTRRASSFIGTTSIEKSGGHGHERDTDFGNKHFTSNWWLSKGYLYEESEHIGTYGAGFSGAAANFEVYLNNEFTYTASPEAINDMGIAVETFLGGSLLLVPRGEEKISVGYSSADLQIGSNTKMNQWRNYLLHYEKGVLQAVAVGHEYWDTSHHLESGAGHGDEHGDAHGDAHGDEHGDAHGDEHGDAHGELQDVRGHNLAFYRAGLNFDLPTSSHDLEVALALNSMLGTSYVTGRIWQEQLEDFAGEHELKHALYHQASAGLEIAVADDVLLLGIGADYAHTVSGNIQQDGKEDGDYYIGVFTFSVAGEVELLHDYGLSLEGAYIYKHQEVDASLTGTEIDLNSDEHELEISLVKSFD